MQLTPIAKAVDSVQGDQCTLADATASWVEGLQAFPKEFKGESICPILPSFYSLTVGLAKLQERSKLCLESPVYLAAYLLHHGYNGKGLSGEQVLLAHVSHH